MKRTLAYGLGQGLRHQEKFKVPSLDSLDVKTEFDYKKGKLTQLVKKFQSTRPIFYYMKHFNTLLLSQWSDLLELQANCDNQEYVAVSIFSKCYRNVSIT